MKAIRVKPYEKVHLIYDYIMQHVDYDDWADYIHEIIEHHKPNGKKLLDVACGSGKFFPFLEKNKYEITGVELSQEMIELAKKTTNVKTIYAQDMRELNIDDTFDIILCLFDSVNYLTNLAQLTSLFDRVSEHLSENGLFIFDVATQTSCIQHFSNYTETGTLGNLHFERRCLYDFEKNIQTSHFEIEISDEKFVETHKQHIYSHEEILNAIENSKLTLAETHGDFDLDPIDDETERAHYVLR